MTRRPTITTQATPMQSGEAGTTQTLALMRRLVIAYRKNPIIYALARSLVQRNAQKDYEGEARDIHAWVRDNIRYVRDVRGVECVQTPDKTIELGCGDCDDKSTLVATLLESIGHPCRFVVVGDRPGEWKHVFAQVFIGDRWRAVETTEPWEFGEVRKKIKAAKVYPI